MKTSFTLLTVTTLVSVVLNITWAQLNPLSSLGDGLAFFNAALNSGDQGRNILDNVINGINEAIRNASEGLNSNNISSAENDAQIRNLVSDNLDNYKIFVNTFISSLGEEIQNVKNRFKSRRLQEVQKRLQELEKGLNDLERNYKSVQKNWQHYDDNKNELFRHLHVWNNTLLNKVNAATIDNQHQIAEAKKSVEDAVNRLGNHMQKCVNGSEAEFKKFAKQVNAILEGNEPSLVGLIREVVQCLQDTDSTVAAVRCFRGFNPYLRQIRNVPRDVANIKKAVPSLLLLNIDNNECIGRELISFALTRGEVEEKVENLGQGENNTVNDIDKGQTNSGGSGAAESHDNAGSSSEEKASSKVETDPKAEDPKTNADANAAGGPNPKPVESNSESEPQSSTDANAEVSNKPESVANSEDDINAAKGSNSESETVEGERS